MKFEEALKAMREGKKVTLKGYEEFYFLLNNKIYNVPFDRISPSFDDSELLSEDWEIVDE